MSQVASSNARSSSSVVTSSRTRSSPRSASGRSSVVPAANWNPSTMEGIFKFLTSQAKSVSTYTTNPLWQIVDGPYKLSQYNTTTGAFTMVPNKTYGGPHVTPMSNFQAVAFTSQAAEFNAIKSKSIDVGFVPAANIPQLPQVLRLGYNYFGEPDFGMNFLNYNFKDTTNHFNSIVSQLYFRQAMAHVEDQQGCSCLKTRRPTRTRSASAPRPTC